MNNSTASHSSRTTKKRGKSILLRLTAYQVWRNIVICIRINLAALFIFAVIMLIYVNYNVYKLMPLLEEAYYSGDYGYAAAAAETLNCDFWISPERVYGLMIPDEISRNARLPSGASVSLFSDHWPSLEIMYRMSAPLAQGEYMNMSFDMYPALAVTASAMAALSIAELFIVFFGIFTIRRSTRRILRPISELTMAAQSINTQPAPPALPPVLKLTGAIDTLNTITEDHLDKRIMIDDEREELKGLASAINAMLDRLDLAYQAQLRFVSDASHELRTPISVIQGYANLLDRWGKRDEKALQESIDAIKSEAMGMESLVEQLLFLARSDNNSIKADLKDMDVSALAEDVLRETEMIDNNHMLSGSIAGDIFVYGDAQLLKQAIRVFMDNALKYTPEGGRIKLSVFLENGEARISVSDTGIGIPADDISHVFERFFRADASRARKTGGTGLGLSIAKFIVDSHGGYVEVVSRENIGTKITAVLPARIARAMSPGTDNSIGADIKPPEAV